MTTTCSWTPYWEASVTDRLTGYTIWAEGFATNGMSGGASYYGQGWGKSFEEACANRFRGDRLYNADTNTYWGCRLFQDEGDARASFG
jgi:hypothetical protein